MEIEVNKISVIRTWRYMGQMHAKVGVEYLRLDTNEVQDRYLVIRDVSDFIFEMKARHRYLIELEITPNDTNWRWTNAIELA